VGHSPRNDLILVAIQITIRIQKFLKDSLFTVVIFVDTKNKTWKSSVEVCTLWVLYSFNNFIATVPNWYIRCTGQRTAADTEASAFTDSPYHATGSACTTSGVFCCWPDCLELIARRPSGSGVLCWQLLIVAEDISIFAVLMCSLQHIRGFLLWMRYTNLHLTFWH